jgi:uncharacterized membrane-anchored protein YitT (DUF2179 family)
MKTGMRVEEHKPIFFGLLNLVLFLVAYLVFGESDTNLMIVVAAVCLSWPLQIILTPKIFPQRKSATKD